MIKFDRIISILGAIPCVAGVVILIMIILRSAVTALIWTDSLGMIEVLSFLGLILGATGCAMAEIIAAVKNDENKSTIPLWVLSCPATVIVLVVLSRVILWYLAVPTVIFPCTLSPYSTP